jgi:hypothetical protein
MAGQRGGDTRATHPKAVEDLSNGGAHRQRIDAALGGGVRGDGRLTGGD